MNEDAIPLQGGMDDVDTIALAASLLFTHGQTTEKTVVAAQQLGRTLGVPVRVLPHWDELVVELDHTPFSEIVPAAPPGVHMGKVLAVQTIMRQVCDGAMSKAAARPALVAAGRMPPVAILRFAIFAGIGAASLGVIFGVYDVASLVVIALSASVGALVRRWQGKLGSSPFLEPLSAAMGISPWAVGVLLWWKVRFEGLNPNVRWTSKRGPLWGGDHAMIHVARSDKRSRSSRAT